MINFNQPDFSKFPAELDKMNVEQLNNFKEGILYNFESVYDDNGNLVKEFDTKLKYLYIDLCNYMQVSQNKIITKYELEIEYFRYPEIAEVILSDLIEQKSKNDTI